MIQRPIADRSPFAVYRSLLDRGYDLMQKLKWLWDEAIAYYLSSNKPDPQF